MVNPLQGDVPKIGNGQIKYFLAEMEKGEARKEKIAANEVSRLENASGFTSELKDSEDRVMHRQYLKK